MNMCFDMGKESIIVCNKMISEEENMRKIKAIHFYVYR